MVDVDRKTVTMYATEIMTETQSAELKTKSPILEYEKFIEREPLGEPPTNGEGTPRYDNFFQNWAPGEIGEAYRETEHYTKFAKEHPDIDVSLRNKMKEIKTRGDEIYKHLKLFEPNMYEAYRIMRGYGISDSQLFS